MPPVLFMARERAATPLGILTKPLLAELLKVIRVIPRVRTASSALRDETGQRRLEPPSQACRREVKMDLAAR